MDSTELLLVVAVFFVAILYSSVGHGGASGYLAVMALAGVAAVSARPVALSLNIVVAGLAFLQFYRTGYFSWRAFWPFALSAIPLAFLGGAITLPSNIHKWLLGFALLTAAARLTINFASGRDESINYPPIWLALFLGAALGFLSGLTGVGGGIFLTPLLLLAHWAEAKTAAGVSALFILANSVAGLAGNYSQAVALPNAAWYWLMVAIAGGLLGSALGVRYFRGLALRRALSLVLVFAGLKLIFF